MEHTGATRAELLVKQRQIALAQQGRELLQEKRNALLQELMRTAEQVMRSGAALERSAGESSMALGLAEEIGRTTRRVNALDNVLIPRLAAQRASIQMVLEEHEREDLFRLKRVKRKLTRRPRAAPRV